jgi:tRNA threonylcarbamoyladenosine biosynthesis protein TsaB
VLVVLDSKREELWVQAFTAELSPLGQPAALIPAVAAALITGPLLLVGNAADRLVPLRPDALVSTAVGCPDAAIVAALAAADAAAGTTLPAVPLYLRPADVTIPP